MRPVVRRSLVGSLKLGEGAEGDRGQKLARNPCQSREINKSRERVQEEGTPTAPEDLPWLKMSK